MKKIFILLSLSFISIFSFSQNLAAFDSEGSIPNGGIVNTYGLANESVINCYISIVNLSASTESVKVIRHTISTIPGTTNNFCWGQCYASTLDTSEQTINIGAHDTTYEFQGEYKPQMNAGTSLIRYLFYNVNNVSDTLSVTVNYIIEALGINNPKTAYTDLSYAYPNPASDYTMIKYTLPKNINNARLIIRDCIGAIVKDQPLTNNSGKVTIDLSDIREGVYFYSVVDNHSAIFTRKLIVK